MRDDFEITPTPRSDLRHRGRSGALGDRRQAEGQEDE